MAHSHVITGSTPVSAISLLMQQRLVSDRGLMIENKHSNMYKVALFCVYKRVATVIIQLGGKHR